MSRPLLVLLLGFLLLAGAYSVVTPAFETPDEIWHFAYIHHLHTERALPVSAPQTTALWRQQGVQAPGYYLAVALLTAWVDASDFPTIYDRANPHAAIGRPGTADNRNYLVHHFPEESFPWRGVFLALHLARFLSVLLAAVTLWAVYGLLAPLVGERLALLATAGLAFTPQFLFVSAAASNDNAINAAAALVLWQLTRLLTGPAQRWRSWRAWGLLGVFLGAALLAKLSGLALVGVVGAAALWMAWRVRSFRLLVRAALACGLPALVLAGWWYVRNWRLYGDPLAWNIWQQNILLRVIPADWRTILAELESLERSYWGLFGWFNVPYPEWVYWAFRGVEVMVALGLLAALLRGVCPEKKDRTRMPRIRRIFTDQKGRMDFHRADAAPICTILPFAVIYAFFHSPRRTESAWGSALKNRIERGRHGSGGLARISGSVDTVSWPDIRTGHGAAAGLVLLWLLALTVSWVRFMRIAPAAQGRYFFPAAPALLLLWAWSWWGLGPRLGRRLAEFTVAGLAVLALLTPWWIIRPAYTPPPMSPAGDAAPEVVFGAGAPQIGLLPGSAPLPTLHPGQTVALDVTWRSLAPVERDYSVFVHLVDEVGLPAAQVDTLPGRGLWATSQWQPGTELRDRYFLHIPETIYTPGQVRWVIGLYHAATGERLPRMDVDAASSLAGAELGRSSLVPREAGSIPNPMQARFGDNISLVGYAFSARVLRPGEPVTVRLYWQARGPVQQDYVAFVHLLDEAGNMFGGHDAPPAPPTSIWAAGQMVEDVHTFILPPETPPGRYRFELGLYTYPDMDRLVVLDASGAEGADRLFLGPVRVEAAP